MKDTSETVSILVATGIYSSLMMYCGENKVASQLRLNPSVVLLSVIWLVICKSNHVRP
jgi:hypothetical protein